MISKKMAEAINGQMNKEFYSAYLYLSMSAWSQAKHLRGFAHWFALQAREEAGHAMKFCRYLEDQGATVRLPAIDAPTATFASPLAVFETTLKHEQFVTQSIGQLMDQAVSEKDHATQIMLQWFVSEQVEEEASASEVVEKLKLLGDDPRGLYLVDRELAGRAAK
jgi:ferritin